MRLINTETFDLKAFGSRPPPYAILSHTWGEEEVTFQDISDMWAARKKKGFAKIKRCCRQALRDGYDWVWVDTCCIDKTSSAELSETINSMYKWYERAMKCYAFRGRFSAARRCRARRPGTARWLWEFVRGRPPSALRLALVETWLDTARTDRAFRC